MDINLHGPLRVSVSVASGLVGRWWALVCVVLSVTVHRAAGDKTYDTLKAMQTTLSAGTPFCYGTKNSQTKKDFLRNSYKAQADGLNVLVYPFCMSTTEFGNRLGNYLTEVACAEASGIHFVAIHKLFDLAGSFHGNSSNDLSEQRKLAYLSALPDIIVHKHPVSRDLAMRHVALHCQCTRYCWGEPTAPWVNRTSSIKQYLQVAMKAYHNTVDQTKEQTVVAPDVDFTNAGPGQHLPIVPDVAIQYRCGDNIGFSYHYGIIPFTAYDSRIPVDSRFIYVLSDHPSRASHSPYSGRCGTILEHLFNYLKALRPLALIVVKRGGDLFLDQVRLGLANTTICSASSYCFWPALANKGQAYFPITPLIAGADNPALAPNFGPNFHWIEAPAIISNLKHYRPWTKILDVLMGKIPPLE